MHQQQDASEVLEHWVAVGRPHVVSGRWEARIENQNLVEVRHFSTTNMAINIDIPQSSEPHSLQGLIHDWHTQHPGIQALTIPPRLLMIRTFRFCRSADGISKITAPVKIEPCIQMPTLDANALQCSNTPYHVFSVILHAGPTPRAGQYTSRLIVPPGGNHSTAHWSTDDARPAKLVNHEVQHDTGLSQQAYILLLGRGDAAANTQ